MKTFFISDLLSENSFDDSKKVEVLGWVKNKRVHKNLIFLDVCDSTGEIQVIVNKNDFSVEDYSFVSCLKVESSVSILGLKNKSPSNTTVELIASSVCVVGGVSLDICPSPRSDFDIFNECYTDTMLKYRHLYLRNPKVMAILHFRNLLKSILRDWFEENHFVDFDAPILVPAPLYDGSTAINVSVHGDDVFLSQCAGFYLESAVHAFERVYNMGPSFRGEESRSKRHLIEYWHIKAEIAWGNREDIIKIVEDVFSYVTINIKKKSGKLLETIGSELCLDGLKTPFPRLEYRDAINLLKRQGVPIDFGVSISSAEEEILSKNFDRPFWIVGIPRKIEPFPYCIDPNDNQLTMVADLIANNGYGELLGVAEKISNYDMLLERLYEKNKESDNVYNFVKDVHQVGSVPHIAFGMGLERMIRWILNIQHVRDAIPFPRVVRRNIYP